MRFKPTHLLCLLVFTLVASGAVHYGHIRLCHCRADGCHTRHEPPVDPAPQKPEPNGQSSCQICLVWYCLGKTLLLDTTETLPLDNGAYWALRPGHSLAASVSLIAAQPRSPPR